MSKGQSEAGRPVKAGLKRLRNGIATLTFNLLQGPTTASQYCGWHYTNTQVLPEVMRRRPQESQSSRSSKPLTSKLSFCALVDLPEIDSFPPRFLRAEDERPTTWDDQLAGKYYESLYREFAVCDLKHYKSGNVRFPNSLCMLSS